jgi:hypothetical protein
MVSSVSAAVQTDTFHASDLDLERVLVRCCSWIDRVGVANWIVKLETARGTRSYLRLPAADGCEAWLIRWPIGSSAPLHDHGAARGLATVLSGALHEWRSLGEGAQGLERTWTAGARVALPRGVCHEVTNLGPIVAYSIHVYDPGLDHMTFYDRAGSGRLLPLRREGANQW